MVSGEILQDLIVHCKTYFLMAWMLDKTDNCAYYSLVPRYVAERNGLRKPPLIRWFPQPVVLIELLGPLHPVLEQFSCYIIPQKFSL